MRERRRRCTGQSPCTIRSRRLRHPLPQPRDAHAALLRRRVARRGPARDVASRCRRCRCCSSSSGLHCWTSRSTPPPEIPLPEHRPTNHPSRRSNHRSTTSRRSTSRRTAAPRRAPRAPPLPLPLPPEPDLSIAGPGSASRARRVLRIRRRRAARTETQDTERASFMTATLHLIRSEKSLLLPGNTSASRARIGSRWKRRCAGAQRRCPPPPPHRPDAELREARTRRPGAGASCERRGLRGHARPWPAPSNGRAKPLACATARSFGLTCATADSRMPRLAGGGPCATLAPMRRPPATASPRTYSCVSAAIDAARGPTIT